MPKLDKRSPGISFAKSLKEPIKTEVATESFGRDCAGRAGSPAQATRLRFLKCMRSRRALEINMLWTIVAILLVLWLLGFGFHVGGSLVHLVLVVALVFIVINLLSGRRRLI